MKRFRFRLDAVLNYRKYLERLAQQETARAQLDVKACEEMIRELETRLEAQARKMDLDLQNGMSAAQFNRYSYFRQGTKLRIDDETRRKAALKNVLKEKIKNLKKKSVDKKVMELYHERQKDLYDQEVRKEEQKELDEISSLKTARKRRDDS